MHGLSFVFDGNSFAVISGVTLRDGPVSSYGVLPYRGLGEALSDTPEPSRYHRVVQFRVLSQHLGAVLGRDRNGLRGEPAIDFIHRVGGERRNQFRIIIRRQ
jgi:hypothetical protein